MKSQLFYSNATTLGPFLSLILLASARRDSMAANSAAPCSSTEKSRIEYLLASQSSGHPPSSVFQPLPGSGPFPTLILLTGEQRMQDERIEPNRYQAVERS
jgi:hypothetical protein